MPEAGSSIHRAYVQDTQNLWDWRSLVAKAAALPDDELEAFEPELIAASNELWRRPVTDWSDVLLRAEIAAYWCGALTPDGRAELDKALADTSGHALDTRVLSHLLVAVLDLTGGRDA